MRVKILEKEDYLSLQDNINTFIRGKEVINVSLSVSKVGYGYYYTACILYKD